MDIISQAQSHHACLWFDLQCVLEVPEEHDHTSLQERRLLADFSQVNPLINAERFIPELGHRIDIADPSPSFDPAIKNNEALIEVDGPSHLVQRPNASQDQYDVIGYNADSVLMTGLTEKFTNDAAIIRIPTPAQRAIFNNRDSAKEHAKAQELLKMTNNLEPGAYEVAANEKGELYILPFFHPPEQRERFNHPYPDAAA
jgi:hypothetical protein